MSSSFSAFSPLVAALGLGLLLGGSGCPGPSSATGPAGARNGGDSAATVQQAEFALGAGDTFDIRVYGESDMSGTYRVAPDGTIDFPLIGQVNVGGMLPHDVARLLQEKLRSGYLRNPQVSILVKEYSSKKIFIVGQVSKPGTFAYAPNMSVVEAITMAGGFTAMAAENDTTVTREGHKDPVRVPVSDISKGRARNYFLRPGDIISVPQRIF